MGRVAFGGLDLAERVPGFPGEQTEGRRAIAAALEQRIQNVRILATT